MYPLPRVFNDDKDICWLALDDYSYFVFEGKKVKYVRAKGEVIWEDSIIMKPPEFHKILESLGIIEDGKIAEDIHVSPS